jgi:hypothetical protein
MESRTSRSVALASILLTSALGASLADGPPAQDCPAIDPPAAPAAAGLRAFRDPVTGRLRLPTEEEKARLREARGLAPKESVTFKTTVRPDGTTSVELGDAFLFDVVATRDADGATRVRCVPRGGASPAARPSTSEEK